jgi:regulator of sirC expression with transglutaminase-like and TPR domain
MRLPDATITAMASHLHFEVPTALQFFAALVADDASMSLLEAAASVAQDEYPQFDTQDFLAQVDTLAHRLRRRIPADAAPLQRLALLNQFFFQELGFAGNVNDYYDARNSYLPDVLSRRRGIPISLALLYIELATQAGLSACGIAFPGHFLVKLRMSRGDAVIDPFTGRSLSRDELDERLGPLRRQRGLVGDFDAPLGLFLQAASPRDIVARLLRNLKAIHRAGADWPRLLAVQERLVVLLPGAWDERRDRGLVLAEMGQHTLAASDLSAYLTGHPEADDRERLRRLMASWR